MEKTVFEYNLKSEPIVDSPYLHPIDLQQELAASEISPESLKLIEKKSAGIMTIDHFSGIWKLKNRKEGYALGITNDRDFYPSACKGFNLIHWDEGFKEFGIPLDSPERFVARYLETITFTDKPVVFFVPQHVFSHPAADITRREVNWYIRHASRGTASNTLFVFGLYSSMDLQTYLTTLPMAYDSRITRMASILADYDKYLKR